MRLFLSSSMFGRHGDTLVAMAGPGARVGVIANALDNLPDLRRDYIRETVLPLFDRHGFKTEELDLRRYFADRHALKDAMVKFDVIWAIGGNSFLLCHAMKLSGFDTLIASLLRDTELIYGGWSAGSVASGSDLFGIDKMDDPSPEAPGYPSEPPPQFGLGLVEGTLVPHFQSDHREAEAADRAVRALELARRPFVTLRDGEVLVRDGTTFILT